MYPNNHWVNFGRTHRSGGTSFFNEFNGIINEILIWDKELDQNQIQSSMSSTVSGEESDLVGYWNFNEGSGSVLNDLTINSNQGAIYGATWSGDAPPVLPVAGGNNSLSFDGVDDYVLVGDNQSLDQVSEEFTISAVVKFIDIQDQGYILSKRYYSAGSGYEIRVANGLLYIELNPGGSAITLTTPIQNDDQFHTVVTTFKNQDHFRLYLDDQLVDDFGVNATIGTNTSFSIPSLTNDENFVIGDFSAMDGRTFHGIIDDIAIYSE